MKEKARVEEKHPFDESGSQPPGDPPNRTNAEQIQVEKRGELDDNRYRTIIEQSPISIIIYSPAGRPIETNPASLALWNITPERWGILKSSYNILEDPQLERTGVLPYIQKAFNGEATEIPAIPYDLREVQGDPRDLSANGLLWIRGYIYPVKDTMGAIQEVVLIQENITGQKIAEQALQRSEERFRELAENIREVFWLFDWQKQKVLYVSPAYEHVWGRSIQDLYERYEDWAESIHPDDLEYANQSFQRIVRTGGGEDREYRIIRPDGKIRWLSDRGFAITDESGQVVRIAGIAEDITARVQAMEDLNRRLAFEETVAAISTRFVGSANLDESIDRSLEMMGHLSHASRVYLFHLRSDRVTMDNTHEWCTEGVTPEIDQLQNLRVADFPWVMPILISGEVVKIDDVSELPPEANALRASLESQDIHSCLLMPIWVADEVAGFMGFDNTREIKPWNSQDIALLRVSSEIIGNALTRKKFETMERSARTRSEALRQAMLALTSHLELDQVLQQLLLHLEKVIPYDSASVILQEGDRLRVKAGRGLPELEKLLGETFPAANPLYQEMCTTDSLVIIADAQADPRFERSGTTEYIRGWMGIPLLGHQGIVGYLTVDSKKVAAYGEDEARLAQTFASQASIAIENARLFEEVQKLAITDPLTGLHNRRSLFDLAAREFERASRYHRPLSAIMIDLDRFKHVNDSHGHAVGDQVLIQAANRFRQEIRQTDILGRYGGEEFVILLPETDLTTSIEVAERVRKRVARGGFETGNGPVNLTASLGIAALQDEMQSIDALLSQADQALYVAKQKGRDCIHAWRSPISHG